MNSSDNPGSLWYYISEDQQRGPVTFEQLQLLVKSGKLDRFTSMVWTHGMASWVPAHQVKGLFLDPPPPPLRATSPLPTAETTTTSSPPVPPSNGWKSCVTQTVQDASATRVDDGKQTQPNINSVLTVGVIGAIGVVLLIAIERFAMTTSASRPQGSYTAQQPVPSTVSKADALARQPQDSHTAPPQVPSRVSNDDVPRSRQPAQRLGNSIGLDLMLIPSGSFTMGEGNEAHRVTLTKSFYLGVYEVTQEQYEKVMGTNPSYFKGAQKPVEQVSWEDAVKFCRRLSELPEEKAAGHVYRLPTEAEWEYACRAGGTTIYGLGDSESHLADHAWFDRNSDDKTHPVGQKNPNKWGIYDMHGNVWEWCADWRGAYPSAPTNDPLGPNASTSSVLRGGAFTSHASDVRSANRVNQPDYRLYYGGFRVAMTYP